MDVKVEPVLVNKHETKMSIAFLPLEEGHQQIPWETNLRTALEDAVKKQGRFYCETEFFAKCIDMNTIVRRFWLTPIVLWI
jgi:hypothetical protein